MNSINPSTWSRQRWLSLLVVAAALGLAGWWGGRQAWAWQQRRAAAAALERYHPEQARDHLTACLAIWPADPQALLLATQAARGLGDFAAAEEHLRTLERQSLKNSDVLDLQWALLRAASGALDDKVERLLLPLAERDPALAPQIWEALIEGCSRSYRMPEAFTYAERWLQRHPDNIQALSLRAKLHRQLMKLQKAVPDYQKVIDLDPTRTEARKWLAQGLIEAGRYADALPHLEMLRHATPDDVVILVLQARAHKSLGRIDEARRLLDAALAREPEHTQGLRVRGELELAEAPAEAEKWLRRAAQAAPFDYQTQFLLERALAQQGKHDEAKSQHALVEDLRDRVDRLGELMSRKLSTRPHDPALHVEMGTLLISLGQKEVGHTWLHSALSKDPAFRPAHAALADYYQSSGDAEKARFHRQRAGP